MAKIDTRNTKVILIGVSEFQDKSFINANPVKNNVVKLKELFQDKDIIGIDEKNILVADKNERHDEILNKISEFLEQGFTDTIFFYFAGHGYKTGDGKFYLITNNTIKKHLSVSSLPWDSIKEILEKGSGIQQRFYILDACHSGAAALGENDETLELEDGSALIAAAKADSKAYFNESDQYTYFTDALINILETGIENVDDPGLTVKPIFDQLEKRLKDKKFEVTIKTTHKAEDVSFFMNKCYDKAAIILKQARICFDHKQYLESVKLYKDAVSEYALGDNVNKNIIIDQIKKEIALAEQYKRIKEELEEERIAREQAELKRKQEEDLAAKDQKELVQEKKEDTKENSKVKKDEESIKKDKLEIIRKPKYSFIRSSIIFLASFFLGFIDELINQKTHNEIFVFLLMIIIVIMIIINVIKKNELKIAFNELFYQLDIISIWSGYLLGWSSSHGRFWSDMLTSTFVIWLFYAIAGGIILRIARIKTLRKKIG